MRLQGDLSSQHQLLYEAVYRIYYIKNDRLSKFCRAAIRLWDASDTEIDYVRRPPARSILPKHTIWESMRQSMAQTARLSWRGRLKMVQPHGGRIYRAWQRDGHPSYRPFAECCGTNFWRRDGNHRTRRKDRTDKYFFLLPPSLDDTSASVCLPLPNIPLESLSSYNQMP